MGGKRDSEWLVVRRCLDVLLRVMRGNATRDDLITIIMQHSDRNRDPLDRAVANRRLEHDQTRLRDNLGWEIRFGRRDGIAYLRKNDRAMIDLSPTAVRGVAFLQNSFSAPNAPFSTEITALLNTLMQALSEERRAEIGRQRALLELDLRPLDEDHIPEETLAMIRTACDEHRLLEFDYYSSKQTDGLPRRHTVEPYHYYFDGEHYYLDAECCQIQLPNGRTFTPKPPTAPYRLGRLNNLCILPNKFVPHRRPVESIEVQYWLAPAVARTGVTRRFEDSVIAPQGDGSAIVTFQSKNLFLDLRELLHYGANCCVLGGDRALAEMKLIVEAMWRQYAVLS
jgi:predicted DNA-binding transcriptional regulator YafY